MQLVAEFYLVFFSRVLLRRARIPAAMVFLLAYPMTTANAGFFDFLFNPSGPTSDPFSAGQDHLQPRQRATPSNRKPKKKPIARLLPSHPDKDQPRASSDFMDDASLQDGDAVMTRRGIRIFTGPSGSRHRPEDFTDLSEIKRLPARARSKLAEIDASRLKSNQSVAQRADIVTGRSAAEPRLVTGTVITDPKGRPIRYVGP